jgi:hypothetical protein
MGLAAGKKDEGDAWDLRPGISTTTVSSAPFGPSVYRERIAFLRAAVRVQRIGPASPR